MRPGNSLLSQGEPWVWLTGSALVIALAMIAFLLALVVWFGATTFWPAPLVRFELASGPATLGEVARTESFSLTQESIERLNDADAARAKDWLGERTSATASRRLIRTGNFELTQNHFRWVSDFEVSDGGETRPEWAVALERMEWGRFHGEPAELSERVPRHAGPDEDDISSLLRLFTDHGAKLDESQQTAMQAETERMTTALSTLRAANVRRFLESIDSLSTSSGETGKPSQWQAVLDDGRVVAVDEVAADSNVVELRASWNGASAAWSQFTERHAAARTAHAEQVRLEKHDLGRVNRQIDDARLRLRAAELAANVAMLDRVDELRTLRDQLQAQEAELSAVDELVSRVSKKYGPDSTVV
ncbi:MAG TPA: hypothetical protein PLV92_21320, partial [Pirellulaceae bacterium]|nr:hypothetical protein [Pirellulaceae bacterium]